MVIIGDIVMTDYSTIDIDFTWDGDFTRGSDGDLGDTSYDLLQSLRNEIHDACRYVFGDWRHDPNYTVGLPDFGGEPNTRETAEKIRNRLLTRLPALGIVQKEDLSARVFPISPAEMMAIVTVNAAATPGNGLSSGELVVVSVVYDSLEDSVFYVSESQIGKEYRGT